MQDGELVFAQTPNNPLLLFVKDVAVVSEFWSGKPLMVDGSTRMDKGAVFYVDEIRALGTGGLKLYDDSGVAGIFVEDGGQVAVGHSVPTATLHVQNSLDVAEVNIFKLEGKRATPTNNDTIFTLYSMNNDNSDSFEYARTTVTAEDITDGAEEGSLLFEVARGGSLDVCLKMSATEIVVNEAGADRDFRLEGSGAANALFVQGSDGKVGIGTAAPPRLASAYSSVDGDAIALRLANPDRTAVTLHTIAMEFGLNRSAGTDQQHNAAFGAKILCGKEQDWTDVGNTVDGYLAFYTVLNEALAEKMRISSAGNVGIGTSSPSSKLSFSTASHIGIAGTDGSDSGYLTIGGGGLWDDTRGGSIFFAGNELSGDGGRVLIKAGNISTTGYFHIYTGGAERFKIDYAGNVGINEASPNAKLDVNGTARFGDSDTNYTSVEADGDVLFVGGGGLHYGEIYAADAGGESGTITISAAGKANKVQITSFSANGVSNGNVTPDHTNDHITTGVAGHYFCAVSMHVISAAGGGADTIGYSVYKNNGATEATNLHGQRDLAGGGGDEGSLSLSGIIDCAASDTIEVWIWNNDSTDNIIVDDINLSVIQVGGT